MSEQSGGADSANTHADFHIVGVGASAGGLESLEPFMTRCFRASLRLRWTSMTSLISWILQKDSSRKSLTRGNASSTTYVRRVSHSGICVHQRSNGAGWVLDCGACGVGFAAPAAAFNIVPVRALRRTFTG